MFFSEDIYSTPPQTSYMWSGLTDIFNKLSDILFSGQDGFVMGAKFLIRGESGEFLEAVFEKSERMLKATGPAVNPATIHHFGSHLEMNVFGPDLNSEEAYLKFHSDVLIEANAHGADYVFIQAPQVTPGPKPPERMDFHRFEAVASYYMKR
jgi:hypothetical protein